MPRSSKEVVEFAAGPLEQAAASVLEPVTDDLNLADDMEEEPMHGKRQRSKNGEKVVPDFPAISAKEAAGGKHEFRRIMVPPHRYTPLRKDWMSIYTPIVEQLKLDVRMNPRNRSVEIKVPAHWQLQSQCTCRMQSYMHTNLPTTYCLIALCA